MKRTLVATMLAVATAALPASANTTTEPVVSGTIVVPAGAARAQRCARSDVPNGTFGYILNVTGGKLFTLTTSTPTIDDVNIGFYKTLTPCAENADVAGNYVNEPGNEGGTVPSLATKAIVYTGSVALPPEHVGSARANVTFTYTQTNPPS